MKTLINIGRIKSQISILILKMLKCAIKANETLYISLKKKRESNVQSFKRAMEIKLASDVYISYLLIIESTF